MKNKYSHLFCCLIRDLTQVDGSCVALKSLGHPKDTQTSMSHTGVYFLTYLGSPRPQPALGTSGWVIYMMSSRNFSLSFVSTFVLCWFLFSIRTLCDGREGRRQLWLHHFNSQRSPLKRMFLS